MHFFIIFLLFIILFYSPLHSREITDNMVLIESGSFGMGCKKLECPENEKPYHKVYLDSYYIDIYEVTNKEFAEFLNYFSEEGFEEQRKRWIIIRSDLKDESSGYLWPAEIIYDPQTQRYRPVPGLEEYPVISVSWYGAMAYCTWKGKRLLTEAEWEKSARAGLKDMDYPWGNSLPTDGVVFNRVWKDNNLPAPVERKDYYLPNHYGLYNMAGNVAEWVQDWYDPDYYKKSPQDNPEGPKGGDFKVIRGGSWASTGDGIRVSFRNYASPDSTLSGVGFRCAMDIKK